MEAKAYVLIEADSGQIGTVLDALRAIADITAADA